MFSKCSHGLAAASVATPRERDASTCLVRGTVRGVGRKSRVFDAVFMAAFAALLVRGLIRGSWWDVGLAAWLMLSATVHFFGKSPQWSFHPEADASKSGMQRWRERRRS